MSAPVLGILGGMGPEATVHFLGELIRLTPAAKDQDHIQCLVDMNTAVPERTWAIENGHEKEVTAALSDSVRRLQAAGCRYLAMPCNTAHFFLPFFQDCMEVPFINLLHAVRDTWLNLLPGKRLALLATRGTIMTKLYNNEVARDDLALILPDDEAMARIHEAVGLVKAGQKAAAEEMLLPELEALTDRGAEGFIVGCTDIPLALPPTHLPVIDSVSALAQACVETALRDR